MGFNIIAVVFVFGLLVLIHELGHFLAAKWMGVRVERFSIGFPPRLFGKKIGDTDYCVSAIPLGGYVKLSGMIDESLDTQTTGADYEFNSKPVGKRIVIIIAGVVMNFILAIFVLTLLNFFSGEKIVPFTEIGGVGENGIAKKVGFKTGDKILAINGTRINNWNDIQVEFFRHLNNDIIFSIQRGNENIDLIYEKEWFGEKNAEYLDIYWMPEAKVGNVIPGMPAAKIGLMRGDEITEIAGNKITNWSDLTSNIREYPGQSIEIRWFRDRSEYAAQIIPNSVEEKDSLGNIIAVGKIGIELYYERVPVGFGKSVVNGVKGTINLITLNVRGLWWVITGTKSAKELIGGPIMIAKLAGDAAAAGWEELWTLIAALSAILAFFNILPIPALDGGHLMFLIIEAVRQKPLSIKSKLLIQQVGMAILLTLIVFILYIDLRRLL
jgi:regulator of sigma E protease